MGRSPDIPVQEAPARAIERHQGATPETVQIGELTPEEDLAVVKGKRLLTRPVAPDTLTLD